ncbi:MAG: hypothetical protein DRO12_03710, partial [Thermoprotei archaeon]
MKRAKPILAVWLIAFLVLPILPLFNVSYVPMAQAQGAGWLSGWSYRKSHEIVGTTAGEQTDYQIKIKVRRHNDWRIFGDREGYTDEGDCLPFTGWGEPFVIKIGSTYFMYFHYGSYDGNIHYATSSSPYGPWEHQGVAIDKGSDNYVSMPCVVQNPDTGVYYMFYERSDTDGKNYIAYATSTDGINWTKQGDVLSPEAGKWDATVCGGPCVVNINGTWYLFYHGQPGDATDKIGFATSSSLDGPWTKYAGNPVFTPSGSGWDSYKVGAPEIFEYGGKYVMMYVGNDHSDYENEEIGFAVSTDLISWSRHSLNPVFGMREFERAGAGCVYQENGTYYVYLTVIETPARGRLFVTKPDYAGRMTTEGKCRSDFGDIRFTSDDGQTLLDYWTEEKVDDDYAGFWVKVSSIPASPNEVTIYVYYGKSDATSESSGADTFPFFDDFSANTISEYSLSGWKGPSPRTPSMSWDDVNGYAVLEMLGGEGQGLAVRSGTSFGAGYIIEARIKGSDTSINEQGGPAIKGSINDLIAKGTNWVDLPDRDKYIELKYASGGSATTIGINPTYGLSWTSWHIYGLAVLSNNVKMYVDRIEELSGDFTMENGEVGVFVA